MTENGFLRRSYDDILTDKTNLAKELFGADIDISVTATDTSGTARAVKFSHAELINVSVKIKATVTGAFPEDGAAQIQDNVKSHIGSLGIGKSLILSTVYGHIYAVDGVKEVTELTIATDGATFSYKNVSAELYQAVVCTGVTVEVTSSG